MNYSLGWKPSALITVIFLWLFSIYDRVAIASEMYAVIATVFLVVTVLNAYFTLRKFYLSESERKKRKRSTPSVYRQAHPK